MRKSILMGMTTLTMSTLAASMVVVAATTGPLNILSAYADKDSKIKEWSPEGDRQGGAGTFCEKHSEEVFGCKDRNVNKEARELCEGVNDGDKCKQDNLNKGD